jgi:type IV secretion system protein VirD4
MSASDCDYSKSQDRVETHYYTIPVGRQELGARILYLEITAVLNQLLRPGRRRTRVTIIFDDFGNYGAPPSVERALTAARGFGVRLWPVVQDIQTLSSKYPNSWQSWFTAAGCRTFMGAQDEQTAEFISKQCGIATVSQWQKSMGKEVEGVFEEGWSRPTVSRPLVHPHEARACPKDRMYLFAANLPNVALVKRIPYFKRSEFAGKYTRDPYYKPKGLFNRLLN